MEAARRVSASARLRRGHKADL